ncbi:MAG: DUF177 domain-containing protein [Bifidobacteriaceae bacterium]|jgi:hypothetical protein|nr:DUF177 domain-containing protein [Bifidobacteriaceae bacterium]
MYIFQLPQDFNRNNFDIKQAFDVDDNLGTSTFFVETGDKILVNFQCFPVDDDLSVSGSIGYNIKQICGGCGKDFSLHYNRDINAIYTSSDEFFNSVNSKNQNSEDEDDDYINDENVYKYDERSLDFEQLFIDSIMEDYEINPICSDECRNLKITTQTEDYVYDNGFGVLKDLLK